MELNVSECKKQLSAEFFLKDAKPHCGNCVGMSNSTSDCAKCGLRVQSDMVGYRGKQYHSKCFQCSKCASKLSPESFWTLSDKVVSFGGEFSHLQQPYCTNCK